MMIENRIRELARLDGGTDPILSMYVDTRRGDGEQRERIRLFLKNEMTRLRGEMGGNGHEKTIERGIGELESLLANDISPSTRGVALFVDPRDGNVATIELPVSVEPQVSLSPRPALRQLVRARNAHPPVLVVMIDGRSARLWRVELDRVVQHEEKENETFDHRNDRNIRPEQVERHQQEHVGRHLRETADYASRWLSDRALAGLVLSGQNQYTTQFREHLSAAADARVLGVLHLDIRASEEDIRGAVGELLSQRRANIARERLAAIKDAGELGPMGAAKVADAANQRRLQSLVISGNAQVTGWRCTSCGTLGQNVPLGCPACGSAVLTLDLVEELIAHAEAESAEVVFVDGPSELDRRDGLGALLRF